MSILSLWEELNNSDEEEQIDGWEFEDNPPPSKEDIQFEEDIRELFQEIIDSEVGPITEEFMTDRKATAHFESHCLGHSRKSRISTRQNVYYDFKDVSLYKERERRIVDEAKSTGRKNVYIFDRLIDRDAVNRALRKLFEGDKYITLTYSCGLVNEGGPVQLTVHSFASDATRNYLGGNTIDILIVGQMGRTFTMYPVDANYFENKFNNILKKHYPGEIEPFKINH